MSRYTDKIEAGCVCFWTPEPNQGRFRLLTEVPGCPIHPEGRQAAEKSALSLREEGV